MIPMMSQHRLRSQLQRRQLKQLLRKRISLTLTTMRTILSLQQRSHHHQPNPHQCKLLLQKESNSFSEIQMTVIALNHLLNPRPQQQNQHQLRGLQQWQKKRKIYLKVMMTMMSNPQHQSRQCPHPKQLLQSPRSRNLLWLRVMKTMILRQNLPNHCNVEQLSFKIPPNKHLNPLSRHLNLRSKLKSKLKMSQAARHSYQSLNLLQRSISTHLTQIKTQIQLRTCKHEQQLFKQNP